jgi:hypothetical protein
MSARIDTDTGLASPEGKQVEFFYREHPPQEAPPAPALDPQPAPAVPQFVQ